MYWAEQPAQAVRTPCRQALRAPPQRRLPPLSLCPGFFLLLNLKAEAPPTCLTATPTLYFHSSTDFLSFSSSKNNRERQEIFKVLFTHYTHHFLGRRCLLMPGARWTCKGRTVQPPEDLAPVPKTPVPPPIDDKGEYVNPAPGTSSATNRLFHITPLHSVFLLTGSK